MQHAGCFQLSPSQSLWLLPLLTLLRAIPCNPQSKPTMTPTEIYDRTHSSVVVIVTTAKNGKPSGQGSGFIVAKNRIVTNHHVLAGASNAVAFFADGSFAGIEGIVADSQARDLMIVSAQTGSRAPVRLGDELSLRQGDSVYAIGAPEGLQLSITNGITSGFRNLDDQFLIQSTAPIAPGSSGGPLLDNQGSVVGVITSLLSGAPGIYFSVGVGDVSRLLHTTPTVVIPFAVFSESEAPTSKSPEPSDVEAVQKLIDAKNYGPAKERLSKLLKNAPNDPDLHKLMGEVDLYQGDNKTAMSELKMSLDARPEDTSVEYLYALALSVTGRYGEAEPYQESVVKVAPTDFNLGFLSEIYYREKKFKEAEEVARNSLEKNPSEETALSVIAGNVFWGRSSSQITWTDLQSRLGKISPDSFWVRVGRAISLAQEGKNQDAAALLQEAKEGYIL